MRRFKISKFVTYPYLKTNLFHCKFPLHLKHEFKEIYDTLPFDEYVPTQTRQRQYRNYHIQNKDGINFKITPTDKNTFLQDVPDSRNKERVFELIQSPSDPFLLNFITLGSQLVNKNHPFYEISMDVHLVRQICYPDKASHNSAEGIHQDGCDYIISACVLDRHNITGGYSSIYDINRRIIDTFLLQEDELVFQDDRNLYHYITPIQYLLCDSALSYGYRDIIGLDINILRSTST